jgi:hypothetical protein
MDGDRPATVRNLADAQGRNDQEGVPLNEKLPMGLSRGIIDGARDSTKYTSFWPDSPFSGTAYASVSAALQMPVHFAKLAAYCSGYFGHYRVAEVA